MTTLQEKAARFRELHQGPSLFVMPNVWDGGSAAVMASLGFRALATSSGATAGVFGKQDGELTRDQVLAHARTLVEATDLPVSADLENGFGDAPAVVAETIRRAAEVGLVGASIEDARGVPNRTLYDLGQATERVAAAVEAARALPFPFTLTARAENFFRGPADLDNTIARLTAYARAGADVLFAPALPDLAAVRAVCEAVGKPVSFMASIPGKAFSLEELAAAGVRRVSLAGSLYTLALRAVKEAALEVKERGTFGYLERR